MRIPLRHAPCSQRTRSGRPAGVDVADPPDAGRVPKTLDLVAFLSIIGASDATDVTCAEIVGGAQRRRS
jgi:hypothetical protein